MSRPKYTRPYPTSKAAALLHLRTAPCAQRPRRVAQAMPHKQTSRLSSGRHSASKMRQPPPLCVWSRRDTSKVDQYVNEFSDLIDLSGYSDPLAIVIKFC